MRGVVQSDDVRGFRSLGRLGVALEQDGRRVSSGGTMLHGHGLEPPTFGNPLVLPYGKPTEFR